MSHEKRISDGPFSIEVGNVLDLSGYISEIDLTGSGPLDVPWGTQPTVEAFGEAIGSGELALPKAYQNAYVAPLRNGLQTLLYATNASGDNDPAETILGAIYNHRAGSEVAAPLRRFLLIVSDLYDSFLGKEKREGLGLPLTEQLPPLATFRQDGSLGPYTFTADVVSQMIGAEVGVVSVPSVYREHPVIWGTLAHETGGHDVLHADPGLLPELKAGVAAMFNSYAPALGLAPSAGQLLGQLWSYWIDEAAADVCGVLNIGPAFALNLVPWLAALRARFGQTTLPNLLTDTFTGAGGVLDTHPVDILRIHLALGATSSLRSLAAETRHTYMEGLRQLAFCAAGDNETFNLDGNLPVQNNATVAVNTTIPLPFMQYTAALVGSYVASTPLQSLAGRSLQDIETWDDLDESVARKVAQGFEEGREVGLLGDPAHLLAGVTLALMESPHDYDSLNKQLADALDLALVNDPVWAPPQKSLGAATPPKVGRIAAARPHAETSPPHAETPPAHADTSPAHADTSPPEPRADAAERAPGEPSLTDPASPPPNRRRDSSKEDAR